MNIFSGMFPKNSPIAAAELLQQISKRAEELTSEEQAKSFVAIRRIDGALKSRDSRIIFGRRGTGKTHILSFVAGSAKRNGEIPCVIDLRVLGSNNSIYSDTTIAINLRATRLIRDLIDAIHDRVLDACTDPRSKISRMDLEAEFERLASCVKSVQVNPVVKQRDRFVQSDASATSAGASASASVLGPNANTHVGAASLTSAEVDSVRTVEGEIGLSVNMGDAHGALTKLSEKIGVRIWILLDEWSSLPSTLQPYLADFIRRAIFPVQNITVQIAAIEFRSNFRLETPESRIGFELGSDIFADINLDDYFVYDSSPESAVHFFGELLYRHLTAFSGDRGLKESDRKEVISSIFSQDRVFDELARASEGVARDFINILQLAAMRSDDTKISMSEIRSAAKDWYERDKQRNLDENPRAGKLLEWIRDEVIEEKRARAFLVQLDDPSNDIDFLFDERVLHIARRSYSSKDNPGVRYRVWKVDYGCYVDLINTAKNPTSFFGDGEVGFSGGEIIVPDDDYRAVRRAILDIKKFNTFHGDA